MLNRALITLCLIFISQFETFAQVLGVPLYSWDFASGLPATWSNGSNSNIGVWEYRGPNTVPSNAITSRGSCAGGSSAFNSLTQSNGFMIFDSNYWDDDDNQCGGFGTGPDPGPHTAWLISNSFSLTGVTGAVVTYQQQFRNYSSTIKVQYSINGGTTWIDMITQSDFPGATAEWKSATFPAGAIGQANVKLRFLYSGSYYHWAIDDITVYKPSINNLSINSTRYTTFGNTSPVPPNDFHDLPYDRYPKTMIVPFKFNAKATNIGSATQTSTNLNVKVLNSANTVLYNQTTGNSNVVAGATGNYTLTTGFTPSVTTGYFRIAYQINQSQTDEAPSNNRDTLDYFITDYQYARDEGPMEDEFTPSAMYAGQAYQVGNIFEGRTNTVKCASVAVAVGPGTAVGTTIRARIYRTDFTNLQATSVEYPVNAWDINAIGQQKLITLQLPAPLTLMTDSIYIVMVENTVGTQAFKVCRSGTAIDQTSFVRYPQSNGLFFMAKMPVVRMNLFTAAQTPGCMNPLANNYLATANIDDGSCDIPGCIYPASPNYNPNATWYDGSCLVSGCTITTACNYNIMATINDGSCIMPVTYFADSDADGFGNALSSISACSFPTGYVTNSTDCNDTNSSVNPNASEECNTIDDNCNGQVNEGITFTTYYADADGDGFGNPTISQSSCVNVAGYVTNNTDCNDANALIKPTAVEICNAIDDNCNGQTNEGLVFVNYYIDTDLDGFGSGPAQSSCIPLGNSYSTNNLDCNNNNANIRPNASEICNSIDDNCNTLVDDGLTLTSYYIDTDGDGFGAGSALISCANPGAGYVTNNTDCNNNNASIRPNATEQCNSIDDNCNVLVDEGLTFTNYYVDSDSDGFGAGTAINACSNPGAGYVTNNNDCNNSNSSIRPNAIETCNSIDDNCNTSIDEGLIFLTYYLDADHDGYYISVLSACSSPGANYTLVQGLLGDCNDNDLNINPNANEICGNNIDENCDGFDDVCIVLGCTNPVASNFNPQANSDNGTCIILGCTEPTADNYNPLANTNDSTCIYFGCIDPFANNFDPTANTDDFSCEYNNAAFSILDTSVCQNEEILIYNQTIFSESDSCIINFGDGFIENVCSAAYAHSYQNPGEYQIEFLYFQGLTSSSVSATVVVNSLPDSVTLGLNYPEIALNYNTTDTYEWYFNGALSDISNPTFDASVNYSTDGFYKVKMRNEFGCEILSDSIYFVIPTYSFNQSETCGPNDVLFVNTTISSQNIECSFENSNLPGNNFLSPYTYYMGAPESFSVMEVCTAFGNNYYSLNNPTIESYAFPPAPDLAFATNAVQVTNNVGGNSIQWLLNGTTLNVSPSAQSVSTYFNNNFQNGNYGAVYTNEFGCISDTGYYFVLTLNATVDTNQGCYPLTTVISNYTDMSAGIECEILLPGLDYTPINSSITYTFNDPGIYQPTLYCHSGTYSSTFNLDPITVFNHPIAPTLTSSYGQVSTTNNSVGYAVAWSLDGVNLNLNTNAISTFMNGVYENGYYSVTYSDAQGCVTNGEPLLVIQPSFEVVSGEGCAPLSAVISNSTDPVDGMVCTVSDGIGGSAIPFSTTAFLNYNASGNYAPLVTCSVGNVYGIYSDTVITVYPDPVTSLLTYGNGLISAIDLSSTSSIAWSLNGNDLNTIGNPLDIGSNSLSGYFFGTITNEFGCTTTTDSLLQIFPSYNLSVTEGCGPLVVQATNTTPFFDGLTCVVSTNGNSYELNNTATLNYNAEGSYSTSISCSLNGQTYTDNGPTVTVFPNAPVPQLSAAYGAVLCSNCAGLITQYYLEDVPFTQGTTAISTLQNGIYQNGNYTAQSVSAQGCQSPLSNPILVVQPAISFSPSESCAPALVTFVNSTDPLTGLSCELFLGNGNGNIPLSYLETYDFNYTTANAYSPYITCTLGNVSANSPVTTLSVNGGTVPVLVFENGFVTCTNCSNQDNTSWIIDGTLTVDSLVSVPDSIGQFFSCDYINEFGCTANSFIVTVEEELQTSFNLFPNPSRDLVNITGLMPSSTLEVRDSQGRLVFKEAGSGRARTIDTSQLSNGIYAITENSNNIIRSGTLLVNH